MRIEKKTIITFCLTLAICLSITSCNHRYGVKKLTPEERQEQRKIDQVLEETKELLEELKEGERRSFYQTNYPEIDLEIQQEINKYVAIPCFKNIIRQQKIVEKLEMEEIRKRSETRKKYGLTEDEYLTAVTSHEKSMKEYGLTEDELTELVVAFFIRSGEDIMESLMDSTLEGFITENDPLKSIRPKINESIQGIGNLEDRIKIYRVTYEFCTETINKRFEEVYWE